MPDDERARLLAENRELKRKTETLQKQILRLDKMAAANEVVHRTLTAELALANEELRIARAAAEHANHTKSEFLANMSHELRTPLNAIIGYSEMLVEELEEEGADDIVADIAKIRAAGQHLLAVISGILDISKIEAGKISLYLETFDVAPLVAEIEAMIAPLARKGGNALVMNVDDGAGAIHADMTKLRQTLFNLLSNATKFTERGTITLAVAREGEIIRFRVTDTGIGMSPEHVARLFQAFSQADASTSRRYGGTGLGLAISRSFCRLMGGDITVSSELGKGSTFVASLPVRVEEPARH